MKSPRRRDAVIKGNDVLHTFVVARIHKMSQLLQEEVAEEEAEEREAEQVVEVPPSESNE